jgi:hypothetical protein
LFRSAPGLADKVKEEGAVLVEANGKDHKGDDKAEDSGVLCGLSLPKETVDTLNEMLDFSLLKDPVFILFTVSNFCTSIGFNVPYIYLIVSITTTPLLLQLINN